MDEKGEAIRRDGPEEAVRRDVSEADVEAHRFRGGFQPGDTAGGEDLIRRGVVADDDADVEGHRFRGI